MTRTITGMYSYTIVDQVGQAGNYTFVTLINGGTTGKKIAIRKVDYQAYAVAITIAKVSKRFSLISSSSVGSLIGAAAIAKHKSSYSNSYAVVRTTNPTVVQVADIKAFAPAIVITAAGAVPCPEIDLNPKEEIDEIELLSGEGVCIYQVGTGTANETMNVRIIWAEYTEV